MRQLREWSMSVAIALPLVAAYIVADRTTGWISLAAMIFFFVATLGLIALGYVHEYHAWRAFHEDMESEDDGAAK